MVNKLAICRLPLHRVSMLISEVCFMVRRGRGFNSRDIRRSRDTHLSKEDTIRRVDIMDHHNRGRMGIRRMVIMIRGGIGMMPVVGFSLLLSLRAAVWIFCCFRGISFWLVEWLGVYGVP